MRKPLIAIAAILLSGLACAVNLTSLPAPTLTPAEQTSFDLIAAREDAAATPVAYAFNAAALDSTTLEVAIAGSVYQLAGVKANRADIPNVDSWKGAGGGVTGHFARHNGLVFGRMRVGTARYEVIQISTGVGIVMEIKAIGVKD